MMLKLLIFVLAVNLKPVHAGLASPRADCSPGQTVCSVFYGHITGWVDECADLRRDVKHYGKCNLRCYGPKNPPTCNNGVCKCSSGEKCNGGLCPDFNTDSNHCGTCHNECSGTQHCVGGACVACPKGHMGCWSADADMIVCSDISKDKQNCGGCRQRCPEGVVCVNGACGCQSGKTWCPHPWSNKNDCVDLKTDIWNCGSCGNTCDGPCRDGKCVSCDGGQAACGVLVGCVNTMNDNTHCGGCWNVGSNCVNGQCSGGNTGCPPHQINCSGDRYFPSCKNVANDNQNCGKCNNACGVCKNCFNGKCV